MRLYKTIAVSNRDDGDQSLVMRKWSGTQSDAGKTRKEFVSQGFKRAEVETFEVDVPTDKQGLLAWLNANCV